ncbi:extracellular solute-binding protein [Paenibacillus sp. J5C_2022]|uniref:extracellular solute-binding protein n=1 Tax=Paenibacillus sp. J5C2022 TaxID=2977129 RepID=UPI0021CFAF28|nr:extracellular solute-binding protein [Paenibacillus sp. J5C2022]MCU6712104.1 extracellular solute-binding protein [Paenibacillus sp. J5C2022]
MNKTGMGVASIALLVLLAGCSGGQNGVQNGGQNGANAGQKANESANPSASTLPEAGTLPLSNEPVTLKIGTVVVDGAPASKDVVLWQEIEEQTNVHIDFQDVNKSQWPEKKGLAFASNELPEAYVGNGILTDVELLNYGASGPIVPLEDLIEEHAPNLKKAFQEYPELKQQITAPDGHIYAIPSFNDDWQLPKVDAPLFVNKSWLEAVGMEPPTTTEQFEEMLKAFKDNDLNGNGKADEIPYAVSKDFGYFVDILGTFGVMDTDFKTHIGLEDGKAVYTYAKPELKEAAAYLHKLYSEGLIDKEVFTQDSRSFGAKVKTVPRIVGVFQGWRSTAWVNQPEEMGDYIAIGPLAGPSGDRQWRKIKSGLSNRGSFVITNAAQNKELLIRWADHLLSDDIQMQMANSGRFGDYLEKTSDNKVKLLRHLDFTNPVESTNTPGNQSRIVFMTESNSKRLSDATAVAAEKAEYDKLYLDYFPEEVYPQVFLSAEESQEIATVGKDIISYSDSMLAQWIVNGGVEKDWDAYLKKLNDMGMSRYIEIYQQALDRQNAAD